MGSSSTALSPHVTFYMSGVKILEVLNDMYDH